MPLQGARVGKGIGVLGGDADSRIAEPLNPPPFPLSGSVVAARTRGGARLTVDTSEPMWGGRGLAGGNAEWVMPEGGGAQAAPSFMGTS